MVDVMLLERVSVIKDLGVILVSSYIRIVIYKIKYQLYISHVEKCKPARTELSKKVDFAGVHCNPVHIRIQRFTLQWPITGAETPCYCHSRETYLMSLFHISVWLICTVRQRLCQKHQKLK